jgi:hypothetical protein
MRQLEKSGECAFSLEPLEIDWQDDEIEFSGIIVSANCYIQDSKTVRKNVPHTLGDEPKSASSMFSKR